MGIDSVAISLGVFAAAVAVEVTFGQWSYAWLTEARGVSTAAAATAVAAFWGGMTALRLVMSRRTVARLIGRWGLAPSAAAAAVVLTIMSVLPVLPDPLAVVALATIGVALAPVIPRRCRCCTPPTACTADGDVAPTWDQPAADGRVARGSKPNGSSRRCRLSRSLSASTSAVAPSAATRP